VIVRIVILRIDLERPTDELFGLFWMAALKAQHAQIVVGVKQIALRGDELAVKALGAREIAGLMRSNGFGNSGHQYGFVIERSTAICSRSAFKMRWQPAAQAAEARDAWMLYCTRNFRTLVAYVSLTAS
jgi:hypothetical protein